MHFHSIRHLSARATSSRHTGSDRLQSWQLPASTLWVKIHRVAVSFVGRKEKAGQRRAGPQKGSFKPPTEHCVLSHPIWPLCEKLKAVLLAKKSILHTTACCGATPSLCPPCTDGHGTTSKLGLQPQTLSEVQYSGTVPAQAAGRVRARVPMLQAGECTALVPNSHWSPSPFHLTGCTHGKSHQHLQIKEQLLTDTQEL